MVWGWVDSDASRGDETQHSFAADEPGEQGGMLTHPLDATVGENDFEIDDHIFDLAVAAGSLACGTCGDPSPKRRTQDRRREVPQGCACALEFFFEMDADDASFDFGDALVEIEPTNALESFEVEGDTVSQRNDCTCDRRARACRNERAACLMAALNDLSDFFGGARPDDEIGEGFVLALADSQEAARPLVAGIGDAIGDSLGNPESPTIVRRESTNESREGDVIGMNSIYS